MIINGPMNRTVKDMTPKQAAMLFDILRQQGSDEFTTAVELQQEWELFPYLYVNGPEQDDCLQQALGFLEEWTNKFREYVNTCEKRVEYRPKTKPAKTKKPKQTQLTLDET